MNEDSVGIVRWGGGGIALELRNENDTLDQQGIAPLAKGVRSSVSF